MDSAGRGRQFECGLWAEALLLSPVPPPPQSTAELCLSVGPVVLHALRPNSSPSPISSPRLFDSPLESRHSHRAPSSQQRLADSLNLSAFAMPRLHLHPHHVLLALALLATLNLTHVAGEVNRLPHRLRTSSSSSSLSPLPSGMFRPVEIPPPAQLPSPLLSSASPSSFNDSLSQYLLLFSSAAYSAFPGRCLTSHLPSPTFTVTHTFNATLFGTSLYGYAGVDSSPSSPSLVFAFQGSLTYTQLYEELTHDGPTPDANSTTLLVNLYFYNAALLLLPAVSSALANLTSLPSPAITPLPLYFTGHSLGGALATVLAYLLTTTDPLLTPPVLYTFGEPRVGNLAFARSLALALPSHYRVVHWRDVVPHLPPCAEEVDRTTGAKVCGGGNGTAGYWAYHTAMEVFYTEAMPRWGEEGGKGVKWEECRGTPWGEDQMCGDGFEWWSVDDHLYYYQLEVGDFCIAPPERATTVAANRRRHRTPAAEARRE